LFQGLEDEIMKVWGLNQAESFKPLGGGDEETKGRSDGATGRRGDQATERRGLRRRD